MSGINGYLGRSFPEYITRGNTLPFSVTFKDSEDVAIDITGWKVYVSLSTSLDTSATPALEVEIPITSAVGGLAVGYIEDSETLALSEGIIYGSIFYVNDSGQKFIIDMAMMRVKGSTDNRVDQS